MFGVSEGDDKAAKHPPLVCLSDVLLLNKTDLLPHVPFCLERFRSDVHRLNPHVQLMELSVLQQQIDPWIGWLSDRVKPALENSGCLSDAAVGPT